MSRKSFARKYTKRHEQPSTADQRTMWQILRRGRDAGQPEHHAAAVADDEELAVLIGAERADVAERRPSRRARGVLDDAGDLRLAVAGRSSSPATTPAREKSAKK